MLWKGGRRKQWASMASLWLLHSQWLFAGNANRLEQGFSTQYSICSPSTISFWQPLVCKIGSAHHHKEQEMLLLSKSTSFSGQPYITYTKMMHGTYSREIDCCSELNLMQKLLVQFSSSRCKKKLKLLLRSRLATITSFSNIPLYISFRSSPLFFPQS